MTTAVALADAVFREANFATEVTSFSTTQTFPYNIAQGLLNKAIDELNEKGRYRFMLTNTSLAYSAGVNTYSLDTLNVDSEAIVRIERTLTDYKGELKAMNLRRFRNLYRRSATQTATPTAWTDYGDTLELDTIPDQDYTLECWNYAPITRVTATTDEISIPERHEHILEDLMLAYLTQRLGRPDYANLYSLAINKAMDMKVNTQGLRSRPNRMPAAF